MLSCKFSKTFNNNVFNKTLWSTPTPVQPQINSNSTPVQSTPRMLFFSLSPKFYRPTPPTPKSRPTSFFWPIPTFYGPTPPTPSAPKFDPRQPRTDAPKLPTPPMHPRCPPHPHYLVDSCKDDNLTRSTNLVSINHPHYVFDLEE